MTDFNLIVAKQLQALIIIMCKATTQSKNT